MPAGTGRRLADAQTRTEGPEGLLPRRRTKVADLASADLPDLPDLAADPTDISPISSPASLILPSISLTRHVFAVQACGIESMPTFQFYKSGNKVTEFSGASEEKIKAAIAQFK